MAAHRVGFRTFAATPLVHGEDVLGVLTLSNFGQSRPFTGQQLRLLETFASQAAIAIANTQLFEELERRNADLQESNRQVTEALEQQTATAEILRVIASSPADLQRLERSLPSDLAAQTRFLLISIDPERDTPEVLRRYAARMGLDPVRWTLLRGRAEDVRELGAALGVAYGKTAAQGELVHSKFVTLLDRQGQPVEGQLSVADDPARVVRALQREAER